MSGQSPYMPAPPYTYQNNFPQRDVRYAGNPSVESAMALNRRPSLLASYHSHFGSPERPALAPYVFSLAAPVSMGPHVDEHSKRTRYPGSIPLSIDVKKEQPLYQPQTEAISPSLEEPKSDCNLRDTAVIRNSICKLESDIEMTMKKLHRAKLSQTEIRSQADRSAADEEENEPQDDLFKTNGSQTLIEKILHDNRKTAEDGQKVLSHLHNNIDMTIPLYQEPSDLEPIEQIRTQYMNVMKNRLINLFRKSRERYMCQTKFESEKYDHAYEQWQRAIEKDEKSILAKDTSTYRETFEKSFPELRKAREDKEKKQAVQPGADAPTTEPQTSVASSATPIEQENEDEEEYEKMRKSSVIPPIMFDRWQRKHQYFNHNGLVKTDAALFYKEHSKAPYWMAEEKQIFIEKFTQSPKNFGYISSFLENKTTEQCVQFYYMTKKTENYKNLLRKQAQANKRRAKQNPTTTTTTTVTSSTTIKTTLVTRVTSNTIVSSTSQQLLGSGQDAERSIDRIDSDVDRRDLASDTGEDKRFNKNRCQFISCTTDRVGKKRNRKSRLRDFPPEWNELSKMHRDEIRHTLQIPSDVQRCCPRCYDKLITHVQERQADRTADDDDDDESALPANQSSTRDDEKWTDAEIDAFTQALDKFNHNWAQIAEYVHRSEDSCRAFYLKQCKTSSPTDDPNNDEDNGSVSGSEIGQTKQANDDHSMKVINEDSNDSAQGMVIDEGEEHASAMEEKLPRSIPSTTNFSTITSLVEKEIYKTLNRTDNRRSSNGNANSSPERPSIGSHLNISQPPPPPLVAVPKPHTPAAHVYSPHSQQHYMTTGSIMRGTPISSSTPTSKPVALDITPTATNQRPNSRNDYSHHKSPKILDRNTEQQQQHHQLLQQHQHAAYMRQYNQQQSQQQQQQQQYGHPQQQQQHKTSAKIEPPSTETLETLRADFLTSKYLTKSHSPGHERAHRAGPDQRSPSQASPSMNQALLPPPATIGPLPSTSSLQSSPHSHHTSQQAALIAATKLLATNGVLPQDLIVGGFLPYPSYYGALPTSPALLYDPRYMHDYASAANSDQLKAEQHKAALRFSRHPHHPSAGVPSHSPPEASYPPHMGKRHSHDMGYPTGDYPSSMWRGQSMSHPQQGHPQMKHNPAGSDVPLMKPGDVSRHTSAHVVDRNTRSPDEYHHRLNQSRTAADAPSMHFPRLDPHNLHKSSHEKSNPNMHYVDHVNDGSSSGHMRPLGSAHKSQASHHSSHRQSHHHPHHHGGSSRTLPAPLPSAQISPQHAAYLMHGHHEPASSQRPPQHSPHQPHYSQQRAPHHHEPSRNSKEPISIQDFMYKNVAEFVNLTNNDNKNVNADATLSEPSGNSIARAHLASNSDQPILIDGDDDTDPIDPSDTLNRSNTEGDMPERRRDSSIKKILSNQPLEKPEYVEINQKVQNSTSGLVKVHPGHADPSAIERSNSANTRTRSRGSITMRMLMGSNEAYVDGKAQPMGTNQEQPTKRPASPHEKGEKIDYLIRDELDRACPTLVRHEEATNIFQRSPAHQSPPNSSKRQRTSPHDTTADVRDPFALQTQSKSQHHPLTSSSPSATDKNWQSYVQQQQYFLANPYAAALASQPARPTGSITRGGPVLPSSRSSADQQQMPSATENQLIHPRYSHYMQKNEQQPSPSRHSPVSPPNQSPRSKSDPKANQTLPSPPEVPSEPSLAAGDEQSPTSKSPPGRSLSRASTASDTPPPAPSPTTQSNSAHPLKKRLISEYELEQQRNSPVVPSEEAASASAADVPSTEMETAANAEVPEEAAPAPAAAAAAPAEEADNSA